MLETNDPKLTAFAFGELPAEEQVEVAALVAASPVLATEVASIRGLGEQLTALLSTEPCPALSDTERTAILQAAEQVRPAEASVATVPAVQPAAYRQRCFWVYTTAATLLMAVTLFFAIPLAVRYTQEPVYRASAWLRVEKPYINFQPNHYIEPKRSPPKISTPLVVPAEEVSVLLAPLGQLHGRIVGKEVEQELLKAQSKAFEEKLAAAEIVIEDKVVEVEALVLPEIRLVNEDIVNHKQILARIVATSAKGVQDPRVQTMQEQLREMEHKRNELLDQSCAKIRERRIAEEKKRRQDALGKSLARIAQNQLEIDLLHERFFIERAELVELKKSGLLVNLDFKETELRREERVVEMISGRIMRLRTEVSGPSSVTLLRKAEQPLRPETKSIWAFWFGEKQVSDAEQQKTSDVLRDYMTTQIQLLHSPLVLELALARPDVAQYEPLANAASPVDWLSKRLSVNAGINTELFIIDFACADPQYAAIIANAIVEAYFRMHTQDEAQRSTRVVELLEDERARRMVIIQQLRDQIEEMKAKAVGKVRTTGVRE